MSLQDLLDALLTSLETGPLITATRHFDARPAVFAPFPSSLDPRLVDASLTLSGLLSGMGKSGEALAVYEAALASAGGTDTPAVRLLREEKARLTSSPRRPSHPSAP